MRTNVDFFIIKSMAGIGSVRLGELLADIGAM